MLQLAHDIIMAINNRFSGRRIVRRRLANVNDLVIIDVDVIIDIVVIAVVVGFERRVEHLDVRVSGQTAARLPVCLQPAGADVLAAALGALVRSLVGVQPAVQLQVNELRELGRT